MLSLKAIPFYLVIFSISISSLFSQSDVWSRIQPAPQEHSLYCVRQIPGTETIVAVGDGSTIMYSEDEGESWDITLNQVGLPNGTQFRSVNFYDDLNGYAADYFGRIIRTTNGGQSWNLVYDQTHDSLRTERVDIYLFDEETAIVVGYNRLILKTEDGGENWTTTYSPIGFLPNSIDFVNQDTGYIVGTTGLAIVLKTTNGGINWTTQSIEIETIYSYSDIYFINEYEGIISGTNYDSIFIFRTTDSGKSWNLIFTSNYYHDVGEIDFKNESHGALRIFSWSHSFLYTQDGGETWAPDNDDFFYNYSPCFSFYYDEDYIIGVGLFGKIGRLFSNIEEWELLSLNIYYDECKNVSFTSDQKGYAHYTARGGGVPSGYLLKTNNGGSSWSNTYTNLHTGDFCFIDNELGYVVNAGSGYSIETLKTINGGDSWTLLDDFLGGDDFDYRDPFVVDYYDEPHGIMAYTGKIYRTNQIGEYWQEIYNGFDFNYMTDIHHFSADTFLVTSYEDWPSKSPILIWSYDGGDNLIFDTLDQSLSMPNSIYFKNRNIAFMPFEQNNTILKSTDGGTSWYPTNINDTNQSFYKSVYFPTEDIGYAVGVGNVTTVLKSTDAGENWDPIDIACSSGLSNVYFHNEWHGLVFGSNGIIMETMTGGVVGLEVNPFVETEPFFTVYPNPLNHFIQIKLEEPIEKKLLIEIINLNGECVYHKYHLGSASENSISINLTYLPSGIYLCRTSNKTKQSSIKVVKL